MVKQEIEDIIGLDTSDAVLASAKAGIGIEDILEQIVQKFQRHQKSQENH